MCTCCMSILYYHYKQYYDCVLHLEFEDIILRSLLERLNTDGWYSDKHSLGHTNSLSEEQLIPLLDHTPEDSDTHNFEYINLELLRLIKTAHVLELIEIDVETVADDGQLSIRTEHGSAIAKLVHKKVKESSPQVR